MTPPFQKATSRPQVELLTRHGCSICTRVHARLAELAGELGFELSSTDVDAAALAGKSELRAEFGDRLPVILLAGTEHSYWEIDEARLRADLARHGTFGSPADKRLP
ncbi:MAG: glutaredoxin family protein [Mycobacterium sp.]